jgi:hypothetical protein
MLIVLLLGSLGAWFHSSASKRASAHLGKGLAQNGNGSAQAPANQAVFISENEMLAMFPPGSCVVAEVNGRKELVFFNAEAARKGFVLESSGKR